MKILDGAIASFLGNCDCAVCERRRHTRQFIEVEQETIAEWDVTAGDGIEEEDMAIRAKFQCVGVTKRRGWQADIPFVYEAEFNAVSSGSDENKSFFAATPSGNIKLSTVRDDLFQVGASYYVDFTEAGDD